MRHANTNYVKANQIVQVDLLDDICELIEIAMKGGYHTIPLDNKYVNKITHSIIKLYGYSYFQCGYTGMAYITW